MRQDEAITGSSPGVAETSHGTPKESSRKASKSWRSQDTTNTRDIRILQNSRFHLGTTEGSGILKNSKFWPTKPAASTLLLGCFNDERHARSPSSTTFFASRFPS